MDKNTQIATPFSASYTPQLPELLLQLNCTIALTTYQAGKVVLISPNPDGERINTLARSFQKPMGIDIKGDQMVIATKDEVIYLENSKALATHYPNKPNTYDSLFVPRTTHYTGQVDLHDIKFGKDGIFALNTSFSCLCAIGKNYNFAPRWQPNFITELESEDRCHLNGLVLKDGYPRYVTALGKTNTPQGWRDHIVDGGIMIDIAKDEIIFDGLAMPHSPMYYNGELYGLLSATGDFVKFNLDTKKVEVIKNLEGFCRGLDIIGDYAFIGMSKLRKNSSTFAKLAFADKANTAGIKVVHIPTKAYVGELTFKASVDEIYEVKIIKDSIRPNILNTINPIHKLSLAIPGKTFWANPEESEQ